jgi:CHAT domain-containing protein
VIEHMASWVVFQDGPMALHDRQRVAVSWKRWVLGAALAAAVPAITVALIRASSDRAIGRVADAAESLAAWPLEARLSGGFPDLHPHVTSRAAVVASHADGDELKKTRVALSAAVKKYGKADDIHALGLAELLVGEVERAVDTLSNVLLMETGRHDLQAAIALSSRAALLSNLSAALLQRVHVAPSSRDSILAFETADRAWLLEQTPEIAWNRAVAVEALHSPVDAIDAWEDYLRLDGGSSWAVGARTRLDALRRPRPAAGWAAAKTTLEKVVRAGDAGSAESIVRAFPAEARALVEDELLSCWARAELSGAQEQAGDCLHRASVIAAVLRQVQGDPLLMEAVRAIVTPSVRGLADAHARYANARALYGKAKYVDAHREFASTIPLFESEGTPFVILARVYMAGSSYNLGRYGVAIEEIEDLMTAIPDAARFRSASGRAHWVLGTSSAFLGNFDRCINEYTAAVTLFRDARENGLAVGMHERLAGAYEMMGDRDRAWATRFEALAELAERGQVDQLLQAFEGGARAAQRHGYPSLARLFTRRELAILRNRQPSEVRAGALSRLAQLSRAEGDLRAAAYYAALAWDVVERIEEPSSRQFARTDPNVLRGVLPEMSDTRRLELLRVAVGTADENLNAYGRVENNLLLSREYARRGDAAAAIESLTEALRGVDLQEQSIRGLQERDAILDEYRSANRELLGLLVQRGQTVDALLHAERSRARTVGDGALDAPAVETESDLRALQRAIPDDTAVVEYVTLDDRVLCWLITSQRIEMFSAPVPRELVRAASEGMSTADGEGFVAAAADASQWLVAPWIPAVSPKISTLVFVTDDETADTPFNALIAGPSMLIDRFRILTAPSLAVHVAARERDRRLRADAHGTLVVVAAVDGRPDRDLEPLGRGRREAERLRRRNNVRVLDDATRSAVLGALPSAGAIHVTTHAITNEDQPSLSALVLQREGGDEGLLYVHEIAGLPLRSTRMVFIAACEAARAGRKGREGTATIGRAFLAAGAPVVIGSTRDLDDTVAAAIVEEFYRRVDAGADPVTALRQTQLSMKGRFAPVDWAPLQVMGGIESREGEPWLSNWK